MLFVQAAALCLIVGFCFSCSTDANFSGQVRGGNNQNSPSENNGIDGGRVTDLDSSDNREQLSDNNNPSTRQQKEVQSGVLTITSASSSFDDQSDMATVAGTVLDAQRNPVANVAVIFVLGIDNAGVKTTVSFAKVTTDSNGLARVSKVVSSGISSDTIGAWELSAQLDDNDAVTVIAGNRLRMGVVYNYSWLNSGTCSTNVLRLKVDGKGVPVAWPASINQGENIRVLVLPTANSGAVCSVGYYEVLQNNSRAAFVDTTHPDTVNTLCRLGATCWQVDNGFTKWSATNQAAAGNQQWIVKGSVTATYMLFATR